MCKTSNVYTILYFSFLGLNLGQELLEGLKYCTWFTDVDSMTKEAVNHIKKKQQMGKINKLLSLIYFRFLAPWNINKC